MVDYSNIFNPNANNPTVKKVAALKALPSDSTLLGCTWDIQIGDIFLSIIDDSSMLYKDWYVTITDKDYRLIECLSIHQAYKRFIKK